MLLHTHNILKDARLFNQIKENLESSEWEYLVYRYKDALNRVEETLSDLQQFICSCDVIGTVEYISKKSVQQ